MLGSRHFTQQQGLTLIELLVGLLVALVVLGAAAAAFLGSAGAQSDNLNLARLNQDMRSMMDIMSRDIRRAGFVTSDPTANTADLLNNPFFSADKDIHVLDDGSCITYSYNADNDSPPNVDNNEHFGFRVNDDGVLQMRSSGTSNTSCSNGSWESITEPDILITNLTFTLTESELNATSMATDSDTDTFMDGDDNENGFCDTGESCNTCQSGQACLYVRTVTISLSGELKEDSSLAQTITQRVRIRNDKFIESL